jgi:hypothetical protein
MEGGGLTLIAKAPIKKGQQVFAPYASAPISNSQLLLDYGFLLENNPNQWYLIPRIPMNQDDENYNKRMALLDGLKVGKYPFSTISNLFKRTYSLESRRTWM